MSVVLFAQNLIETATVTCSFVDLTPLGRLSDRDHGVQYSPAFPQVWTLTDSAPLPLALGGPALAQVDIDVDLGSAKAVSAWAHLNHNLAGVTITLFGDNVSPAATVRDSFAPPAVDFLRSFATVTLRHWRRRVPAMAVPPLSGEWMLGVPRVIATNPTLPTGKPSPIGNVAVDRSPGGHPHSTKLGAKRTRLNLEWQAMPEADLIELLAAYDECDQGAKNLLVVDQLGTPRWMTWLDREIPIEALGGGDYRVRATFEEVPL